MTWQAMSGLPRAIFAVTLPRRDHVFIGFTGRRIEDFRLATKARSIMRHGSVASWFHDAALRVGAGARADATRLAVQERMRRLDDERSKYSPRSSTIETSSRLSTRKWNVCRSSTVRPW